MILRRADRLSPSMTVKLLNDDFYQITTYRPYTGTNGRIKIEFVNTTDGTRSVSTLELFPDDMVEVIKP